MMRLISLEIENYRSLENVALNRLDKYNVFIGRNNSGKSAIFSALQHVRRSILGNIADTENVQTDNDPQRILGVSLTFQVHEGARSELVNRLGAAGFASQHREGTLAGPYARKLKFDFRSSKTDIRFMHPDAVSLLGTDGNWMAVHKRLNPDDNIGNPQMKLLNYQAILPQGEYRLAQPHIDLERITHTLNINLGPNFVNDSKSFPPANAWPLEQIASFFERAFFFDPFRHSMAKLPVQHTNRLASDGSNLGQILHTLLSNQRRRFDVIDEFVRSALPGIGMLQPQLRTDNHVEVGFVSDAGHFVRTHEMGAGIEQLLMVATVLATTGEDSALFVEEPETHLHSGAQRFLIERLLRGSRQIFLTTHSATFINSRPSENTYQLTYANRRTRVTPLLDAKVLAAALDDIGVRNSDVLLSDAVLFVEGSTDKDVLLAFSETMGASLSEHNVTILSMGGGEYADRYAPVRSEVLEGISQKAPVPHLFLLDRDERNPEDVEGLKARLPEKVHFLEGRELENYLLNPHAILTAFRGKSEHDASATHRVHSATVGDIDKIIDSTADGLYGLVLIKRIRWELKGIAGGLLTPETAKMLAVDAAKEGFHVTLQQRIHERLNNLAAETDFEKVVREQKAALDSEWKEESNRRNIAPGEELINAVFSHFGFRYNKAKDAERIARAMKVDQIPQELKDVLTRIVQMTRPPKIEASGEVQ